MSLTDAELERATLPVLVAAWARIVDVVHRGEMSLEEYRRDIRVRHEIARRIRSRPVTRETRETLAELDEWLRDATVASTECVLGPELAAEQGLQADAHWYFWRALP